jgi:hypothetical protein
VLAAFSRRTALPARRCSGGVQSLRAQPAACRRDLPAQPPLVSPHSPLAPTPLTSTPIFRIATTSLLTTLNAFALQIRVAAARPNLPRAQSARAGAAVISLAARHVRAAGAAVRGAADPALPRLADDRRPLLERLRDCRHQVCLGCSGSCDDVAAVPRVCSV